MPQKSTGFGTSVSIDMRHFHLPAEFVTRPELLAEVFRGRGFHAEIEPPGHITVRFSERAIRITFMANRLLGNAVLEDPMGKGRPDPADELMLALSPLLSKIGGYPVSDEFDAELDFISQKFGDIEGVGELIEQARDHNAKMEHACADQDFEAASHQRDMRDMSMRKVVSASGFYC